MEHLINKRNYFFLIVVFAILIMVPNFSRFIYGCYNTWDLGIFVEAVQKLSLHDLNPLVKSYDFKIFNDHFDPILFVPAILSSFLPVSVTLFSTEIFFVSLSLLPVFWLAKEKRLDSTIAIIMMLYLLFGKGTLTALYYPAHPTTWAMAPFGFLIYGLVNDKKFTTFLSLIVLMSCKEEFPFVGIMTAVYLFYKSFKCRKSYIYPTLIMIISVAWLVFAIKVRPIFFGGNINDHGGRFLKNLLTNPAGLFFEYDFGKIKFILLSFLPVILIIFFNRQKLGKLYWPSLFIALPILGLRVLSGKFGFQYTAPLVVPFALLFIDSGYLLNKREFTILILVMLLISTPILLKENLTMIKGSARNHCPFSDERSSDLKGLLGYNFKTCTESYSTGGANFFLASQEIYTKIVAPLESFSDYQKDDCLILDIAGGDPFPRTDEELKQFKSKFLPIYQNKSFQILKPNFN